MAVQRRHEVPRGRGPMRDGLEVKVWAWVVGALGVISCNSQHNLSACSSELLVLCHCESVVYHLVRIGLPYKTPVLLIRTCIKSPRVRESRCVPLRTSPCRAEPEHLALSCRWMLPSSVHVLYPLNAAASLHCCNQYQDSDVLMQMSLVNRVKC